MSHAVPVLACADPLLDDFIDGQTAKVLHDPSAESWAKVIIGVANDRDRGMSWVSPQQWVGQNRLASMQLDHLIATYRQLTGEPIAFPGQAQAS